MKSRRINIKHQMFTSDELKIGEMMEWEDNASPNNNGGVILRTYDRLVCLNNPSITFKIDSTLCGRKLQPGEGISLIQE